MAEQGKSIPVLDTGKRGSIRKTNELTRSLSRPVCGDLAIVHDEEFATRLAGEFRHGLRSQARHGGWRFTARV